MQLIEHYASQSLIFFAFVFTQGKVSIYIR